MTDSYRTLSAFGEARFTEQKSVFIGRACFCETEEKALELIKGARNDYPDAKHHCYAYILGANEGVIRYSDDGEPGGTAGLPILSLIRSEKLVNCCVVVTRYFGGILLGTGGLVRAYTQGCRIALAEAKPVWMEKTFHELCEVPYGRWDSVQYALERLPARIKDISYAASVSFTLLVRRKDQETVMDALEKASGRQLEHLEDEENFEAWDTPS